MKTKFATVLLALLCATAFAQGTFQYHVNLSGTNAVPPNGSQMPAFGDFNVVNGSIQGYVSVKTPYWTDVTSMRVFRSTSSTQLGTPLYDFTPGTIFAPIDGDPGSRQYDINQAMSGTDLADLNSGFWWVNVATTAFPNGEIRGQILSVPEPSTLALGGLSLCATLLFLRKRTIDGK
jgi:hypothetical protein